MRPGCQRPPYTISTEVPSYPIETEPYRSTHAPQFFRRLTFSPPHFFAAVLAFVPSETLAKTPAATANRPWMNTSLTPDQRADMVQKELTLAEKIQLVPCEVGHAFTLTSHE